MEYDQVVIYGELFSTTLVNAYLQEFGLENLWLDARQLIVTDDTFRDAGVDWYATGKNVQKVIDPGTSPLYITQGFIGGTHGGLATTLGREGSDFSGAILAHLLEAESLTIWKDVPGVLTADPKVYPDAELFPGISYEEAIELAFYGAKVIHPKTLKPLQNKQIPLYVKSFIKPGAPGTRVGEMAEEKPLLPVIIQKENQALLTVSPADLSFAIEFVMEKIFSLLFRHHIKAHLIQVSAIRFSVCVDNHPAKLSRLLEEIGQEFLVELNKEVQLVTIRHFRQEVIDQLIEPRKILIEQRNRQNVHFVMEQ
jgi:aspartate kinase